MTLDEYLKGVSPTALADKANITTTSLYRIRKGMQRPSFATIDNLVKATGGAVRADDILAIPRAA
jgi:predicted transcriptional regulator